MPQLFDRAVDYCKDVFRNIRGINISQDLFDDLSDDPLNWEAANALEIYTHPPIANAPLIQRPFDYSKNDFISYPFENLTSSRFSDGSIACWYGSETLETSIYETSYHFIQEILDSEVFIDQKIIKIDRRVAQVNCRGLAFDLTSKKTEFPWLTDSINYTRCQEIGRRVASEGHPLLIVPSARQEKGVNLVAFTSKVLSNSRDYCKLHYVFNINNKQIKIFRGGEELCIWDESRLNLLWKV
ncbi:MAG: RES family NAD+ phosphorylase [Tatlockia sp.]|nr:RES family NAD+ phosphorylase [Tatlockia sp.]